MRIIHCADLHLDSKLTANLPKEKIKTRKAELVHTFLRMVEFAKENLVQAILIAGDMFDTKGVSASTRNTVYQAICQHPQIDFYYLKGNHDVDSFLEHLDEIPANLKLFTDCWTSYKGDKEGKVIISGIELDDYNSGTFYHSVPVWENCFHIVMLHGQEAEYKGTDRTQMIPLRELQNKGIDYLALGHIHGYKEGRLDARGIWCYPGCLEGRGFDECGSHGFVILDVDFDRQICRRKFVPFAYRTIYTLEVDITDCFSTEEVKIAIERALEEENCDNRSLIKIVLKGQVDIAGEIHLELLRKQLEDRCYFLKIQDQSKRKVDCDDFLLDQSLKGEFVRRVMADLSLKEEEKAEVIRYGIQVLAGEEMD